MSNSEQMEENVRNYFFLSDSIDVDVQIIDTLHAEEVEELIASVDRNLNLIDQDLDTLSLMIDDKSYKKLDYQKAMEESVLLRKNKYQDSIEITEKILLEYQLKQALLGAKHNSFKQTSRVLLHLKRSIWANVAGYNVSVSYAVEDEPLELELLLDANLNVVD